MGPKGTGTEREEPQFERWVITQVVELRIKWIHPQDVKTGLYREEGAC